MKLHDVRVHPSKATLPREDNSPGRSPGSPPTASRCRAEVAEMIINRIIDNAAVAIAAINRGPRSSARDAGARPPARGGATVFGVPPAQRVSPEWAAWANGIAVRELDMHDTFLAADYSHPGDNIPPILAVAQQCGRSGADLRARHRHRLRNPDRPRARDLPARAQDRPHRPSVPGAAAGIGTLLGLPTPRRSTRRCSRRCMSASPRGSRARARSAPGRPTPRRTPASWPSRRSIARCAARARPSPIYEGEDSVIAWMLDGPNAHYDVPLPAPGEAKRAILDSYTKEHCAEYQSQALIDLAFRMREQIADLATDARGSSCTPATTRTT